MAENNSTWPIGSREEVEAAGLDPSEVASCSPLKYGGAVRGCPVWEECRFNSKKFGAFKGQGPRNVGYYLQTHEGNKKEDCCSCYTFVTSLQARMDAGIAQRQAGKNGEIIRIVAQEGEKITTRVGVPVNEKDKTGMSGYKFETKTMTVPRHPRPGDHTAITYDQELAEREKKREAAEKEAEDAIYARIEAKQDDDESFGPTAEPVKKEKK